MRTLLILTAALAFLMPAAAGDRSPAEQLGWTLAVHSYTFRKSPILGSIETTAALGIRHASI